MRIFTAAAALLLSSGAPLAAQATHDQARIAFGVALGYIGRSHLWSVSGQPLADAPLAPDTLSLSRQIRSGLTVGFQGTYFPGEHFGYSGEVFLLGLGFLDSCNLTYASGSSSNAQTCDYIDGAEKAATAVALSGGVVYRFSSRRAISPFVRASAGVIIGSQSSVRTEGQFTTPEVGREPVIVVV
nr:hypothetical protein [Gemmatimonadales bacterium]